MNRILKNFFTRLVVPRQTIDEREVAQIVERAWIDNVENPQDLGYALAFAHARFNEVVGEFVRSFYREQGTTPVGMHWMNESPKAIYFSPRARSFVSQRLSPARSNAA